MTSSFILILVVIFLLPLIPAFMIYKFLPSKTSATGPFKGLNVKLSGAFAGYFLLLLIASGLVFPLMKNEQQKTIDELTAQLKQIEGSLQEWKMDGNVISSIPEQTKFFYDEESVSVSSTGDFEVKIYCTLEDGKPKLPRALCFFNKQDGYKVVNINRQSNPPDLTAFNVSFNDSLRRISIGKPIDLQSKKADSVRIATALLDDLKKMNVNIPAESKISKTVRENVLIR